MTVENQHRMIKGYRELGPEEIDLMNRIKEKGLELEALLNEVAQVNANVGISGPEGQKLVADSEANRWTAIAKKDLQTGLMALTRAVAKPGFF